MDAGGAGFGPVICADSQTRAGPLKERINVISLYMLGWAFGAGILAAAPMGPVNAVAIRRGLIHRWTHTMFVALGSVLVEGADIAIAFWGGRRVMALIPTESLHRWAGLPAAGVVITIGLVILRKAIVNPQRTLAAVRLERMRQKNASFIHDVLAGAALTAINPATLLYWLGVGTAWLEGNSLTEARMAVGYGVIAAIAGLVFWFTLITVLVLLRPQNVGPRFFRIVNIACGAALTLAGIIIAVVTLWRM